MNSDKFIVPSKKSVKLSDYPADETGSYRSKEDAQQKLESDVRKLTELQGKLYAQDKMALLVILQGIDASGKDGTVKHVMSGVNPTGCIVKSFKSPTYEELDHDYLWRHVKALPERGMIGIFSRSYYEEVLVVRVHPELLEINEFERYLVDNGTEVLKFFLHLSKDEQKRRFLSRLDAQDKNWKFSDADVKERELWDEYQSAYEDMLNHTSSEYAPWHVVPADYKWFTRTVVADAIVHKLENMDLSYPEIDDERARELASAKQLLENEK